MKKILLIFVFALTTLNIIAQSEIIVAGDNVCLRFRPDEGSRWTGSSAPHFYTGQRLRCVGTNGNYYRVVYGGNYYYFPMRYARPRGQSGGQGLRPTNYRYIIIAGDNVCFRTQPNENSKVTGSDYVHLNTGDVLDCVGTVGNYYKVVYGGYYYYVPKKYGRPRY